MLLSNLRLLIYKFTGAFGWMGWSISCLPRTASGPYASPTAFRDCPLLTIMMTTIEAHSGPNSQTRDITDITQIRWPRQMSSYSRPMPITFCAFELDCEVPAAVHQVHAVQPPKRADDICQSYLPSSIFTLLANARRCWRAIIPAQSFPPSATSRSCEGRSWRRRAEAGLGWAGPARWAQDPTPLSPLLVQTFNKQSFFLPTTAAGRGKGSSRRVPRSQPARHQRPDLLA